MWPAGLWPTLLAYDYRSFHGKALGLFSITLFCLSYFILWDTYTGLIPTTPSGYLWLTMAVGLNVNVPLTLVTLGPFLEVPRPVDPQSPRPTRGMMCSSP